MNNSSPYSNGVSMTRTSKSSGTRHDQRQSRRTPMEPLSIRSVISWGNANLVLRKIVIAPNPRADLTTGEAYE
jgi:hypothetical protein